MAAALSSKILVVDDEVHIVELARLYLTREGYEVEGVGDGDQAMARFNQLKPDLVILDIMLPGIDGLTICKLIRKQSQVPIIMLTARDEAKSRIEGLTIGADDYVAKPFEPKELSLRIASILRRARPAATPAVEIVQFGDFRFHIARGELKRGEEVIRLTDREREMLRLLAATPGETVTRQALAGSGGATGERAVDVQVNRLRRKIERDPANPLLVQTVRGIGYRLVTAP